jgi:hypothetical protein
MILLTTYPKTRVNDTFAADGNQLDFTVPPQNVKDPIIKGVPNQHNYRFDADFYKKIGVDIVTETVFEYPYPFITEKTYRSIACLRPFVIVGPYQTLHFIRTLGFKTFSVIINEEYDNLQDPMLRFDAVCNSISTFINRPLAKIKHDVESVSDILVHNNKVLSELTNREFERFKLQINQ